MSYEQIMSLNTVCWADIPVKNLDRAIAFYTAVLGSAVSKEGDGGFTFGLLPHSEQNASGCLVEIEDNEPSQGASGLSFGRRPNGCRPGGSGTK